VEFSRAVNRQSDQKVVLLEECRPFLVDENAVGLDRVFHPLAGSAMFLDKLNRTAKEVQPHHRRLSALPRQSRLQIGPVGLASK